MANNIDYFSNMPSEIKALILDWTCSTAPVPSNPQHYQYVCREWNHLMCTETYRSLWRRLKQNPPPGPIDLKARMKSLQKDPESNASYLSLFKALVQQIKKDYELHLTTPFALDDYTLLQKAVYDKSLLAIWRKIQEQLQLNHPPQTPEEIRDWFKNPANQPALNSIASLDLSRLNLKCLPEEIGYLTSLRKLSLGENQLSILPDSIGNLISLKKLFLDDNQLSILPDSIGNLISLKKLTLSANKLRILPEPIGNLISLMELDLSYNKLTALPESFGRLIALRLLVLDNNRFSVFPESLSKLSTLTMLSLSDNQISSLPEVFSKFNQLIRLHLNGNFFSTFPQSLCELTTLRMLDLDDNSLKSLPNSWGNLTSLTKLLLNGNNLDELSESIGDLTSLTDLQLSNNHLSLLPESITKLCKLKKLILNHNKIIYIPRFICELTSLNDLDLNHNQLSFIPEEIGKLNNLDKLLLSNNELKDLPETIGDLVNLTFLFLNNNQLTTLPKTLVNLTELTKITINDNPVLAIPKEILFSEKDALRSISSRLKEEYSYPAASPLAKYYQALIGRAENEEFAPLYHALSSSEKILLKEIHFHVLHQPQNYHLNDSTLTILVVNEAICAKFNRFNPSQQLLVIRFIYQNMQQNGETIDLSKLPQFYLSANLPRLADAMFALEMYEAALSSVAKDDKKEEISEPSIPMVLESWTLKRKREPEKNENAAVKKLKLGAEEAISSPSAANPENIEKEKVREKSSDS